MVPSFSNYFIKFHLVYICHSIYTDDIDTWSGISVYNNVFRSRKGIVVSALNQSDFHFIEVFKIEKHKREKTII